MASPDIYILSPTGIHEEYANYASTTRGLNMRDIFNFTSGPPGFPLYDVANTSSNVTAVVNSSNVTRNLSDAALLEVYLGSRYRSLAESSVLTVVYTLIFLTGVIGNVSTCIVIIKNNYMHTATNYYLFSLAISDVLTLILGLPPELYTIWEAYPWRLGTPYCLFKTFLTEMTSTASILTIAAFTVERYVAICHPIKAQTMSSLPRAIKIIIGIWITAALSALPYPIHTRTYFYVVNPDTNIPLLDSFICTIKVEWMPRMRYIFQLSTFLLFILPMGLITSLYVMIGITLRRSGLARQTSAAAGSPPHSQSRRTVLKMLGRSRDERTRTRSSSGTMRTNRIKEIVHTYLVAVVVAFFICWAPFHAQRLMTVYIQDEEWTPTLLEIQSLLFYISGVLFFVSSTVNPILYNLMSKKYRQAFKDTLCGCCRKRNQRGNIGPRLRYGYERSTTFVTFAHMPTSRGGAKRNSRTQHSPLMKNTSRTCSDTSEDEYGRHPYSYKNSAQHWPEDKRNISILSGPPPRINTNGRINPHLPLNGNVTSDGSGSGSQSSSPTTMAAHIREELEMTRLKP